LYESFNPSRLSGAAAGGALPEEITQWPRTAPDAATIHVGDPVDGMYAKVLAIYQMPAYSNYTLILPDKPLNKPFDPDMANYDEWGFSFAEDVKPGISGTSSVTLFFKNGRLVKITNYYNESRVYN